MKQTQQLPIHHDDDHDTASPFTVCCGSVAGIKGSLRENKNLQSRNYREQSSVMFPWKRRKRRRDQEEEDATPSQAAVELSAARENGSSVAAEPIDVTNWDTSNGDLGINSQVATSNNANATTLEADVQEAPIPREGAADAAAGSSAFRAFLPDVVDATGVAVVRSDREEEQIQARRRRLFLTIGATVCFVIASGIIIPLAVLRNDGPPVVVLQTPAPTAAATAMPTASPSMQPTIENLTETISFLQRFATIDSENNDDDDESLWWNNRSSAPYKAALWLSDDESANYAGSKRIQRFALATFYYSTSTNDNDWTECGPSSTACSGNRWLSSDDECSWVYVSCADDETAGGLAHVTDISFSSQGNNLRGTLPPQLSLLSKLQVLAVPNNALKGSVDRPFRGISTLRVLNLYNNDFSGTAPTLIWKRNTDLQLVVLGKNRFSGKIPEELSNLSKLKELQLHDNQFDGSIPTFLGPLSSSLEILELDSNQLTGTIPRALYALTTLNYLNITNNSLSGTVDFNQMAQLSNLEQFSAGSTQLFGTLPDSIFASLTLLRELDLQHSSFQGTLSEEIALWNSTLEILWLQHNDFTGTLPQALDILTHLSELRLEGNQFSGTVSETVCQERGDLYKDLVFLTVDCQVECNCCDNYDC